MKISNAIKAFFHELTSNKAWQLFILLCVLQWFIGFINSEFLSVDNLFDDYMESKMQEKYGDYDDLTAEFGEDIEDLEDQDEYYWRDRAWDLGLLLISNIVKISIISIFIFVGLTLRSETDGILFKPIFKVVIISEFIFFIPLIIKLLWFLLIDQSYDYLEIRNFEPLSLLSLFGADNVESWLIYTLRTISLFEIAYVYLLVIGVSTISRIEVAKVEKPVIISYSLMLIMWISIRIYVSTLF